MKYILIALLFCTLNSCKINKNSEMASTPPMGWNSWNWFGKDDINEVLIYKVIDAMVDTGLRDAGYDYVVIDGGWRDVKLGPNGELLSHPTKFPNGIKPLADYAHSKGMKLGLHTVPGTHDCGKDPVGGYGHEDVQIQQFVDWGIDFIKLDKCKFTGDWDEETLKDTYFKWSKLLKEKSKKNVVLNISAYIWRDWYPEISQMARTTPDITARVNSKWSSGATFYERDAAVKKKGGYYTVMDVAKENSKWAQFAGNGYWNDPDMMVTGDQGLSLEQQESHFALWSIMSSPLMLGNNPLEMSAGEKKILLNKLAIMVNQDPTEQGKLVKSDSKTETWVKHLNGDKIAILLLNKNEKSNEDIKITLKFLGLKGEYVAKDIFNGEDLGVIEDSNSYKVAKGSCLFVLLSKE